MVRKPGTICRQTLSLATTIIKNSMQALPWTKPE